MVKSMSDSKLTRLGSVTRNSSFDYIKEIAKRTGGDKRGSS